MHKIKADGVATIHVYRAWFDFGNGEYRWSNRGFRVESEAREYGKRVAERYNRIFGKETKDETI